MMFDQNIRCEPGCAISSKKVKTDANQNDLFLYELSNPDRRSANGELYFGLLKATLISSLIFIIRPIVKINLRLNPPVRLIFSNRTRGL